MSRPTPEEIQAFVDGELAVWAEPRGKRLATGALPPEAIELALTVGLPRVAARTRRRGPRIEPIDGIDIMYTMRDVDDNALFPRVKQLLTRLQEKRTPTGPPPAHPNGTLPEDVPQCQGK